MSRSSFLNTAEDLNWLREVHLSKGGFAHRWKILNSEGDSRQDGPYLGDFTEFTTAILYGNEDAPDNVDLYEGDAQYNDPFVRWIAK